MYVQGVSCNIFIPGCQRKPKKIPLDYQLKLKLCSRPSTLLLFPWFFHVRSPVWLTSTCPSQSSTFQVWLSGILSQHFLQYVFFITCSFTWLNFENKILEQYFHTHLKNFLITTFCPQSDRAWTTRPVWKWRRSGTWCVYASTRPIAVREAATSSPSSSWSWPNWGHWASSTPTSYSRSRSRRGRCHRYSASTLILKASRRQHRSRSLPPQFSGEFRFTATTKPFPWSSSSSPVAAKLFGCMMGCVPAKRSRGIIAAFCDTVSVPIGQSVLHLMLGKVRWMFARSTGACYTPWLDQHVEHSVNIGNVQY